MNLICTAKLQNHTSSILPFPQTVDFFFLFRLSVLYSSFARTFNWPNALLPGHGQQEMCQCPSVAADTIANLPDNTGETLSVLCWKFLR